jgi:hypothetical protein
MRRALKRLLDQGIISAQALAWCDVQTGDFIEWQGGGVRQPGAYLSSYRTPNWRTVSLTRKGIAYSALLARASATEHSSSAG